MLKPWQKELDKVLPDKPDLIVLPECCDIVYGLTDEKRIEYNKVKEHEIRNFYECSKGKQLLYSIPASRLYLMDQKEILPK